MASTAIVVDRHVDRRHKVKRGKKYLFGSMPTVK